jgi:phosphatidylserine/phosphatidylglycerophosphate/cardiolipin synthase-like enzyme
MYTVSNKNKPVFILLMVLSFFLLFSCKTETDSNDTDVEDVKVYFSPGGKCDEKIIAVINNASSEINVAVYSFNRTQIIDALVAAEARGVTVKVVVDANQAEDSSQAHATPLLEAAKFEFRKKTFPKSTTAMHDKFMIVDKKIVTTGSYNWTTNATENNDENLIIITSQSTAAIYNEQFNKIWDSTFSSI